MRLNRFKTVPYKLFLSFTILIVLTTLIVGTTSYVYFTSNFNDEIEKVHADMLGHTSEMMESNVLQKAEKVYVELAMNPELSYLFENPMEGNYAKIVDVQRILNNVVRLYPDLLESVSVYYRNNQTILSSMQGITYLDDLPDKIVVSTDWIRQMEQAKSAALWIGIRKESPVLGVGSGDQLLFTYVRAYPFNVPEIKKLNPQAADSMLYGVPPKGPNGKMGAIQYSMLSGAFISFGKQLEKEPDKLAKILQVIDAISATSYENYVTAMYGIEGKHFEFDKNKMPLQKNNMTT